MTGMQSSFILHPGSEINTNGAQLRGTLPINEKKLMVCRGAIQMSKSVEESVIHQPKSEASNAPELWTLGTR